jgi:hypothetical protein
MPAVSRVTDHISSSNVCADTLLLIRRRRVLKAITGTNVLLQCHAGGVRLGVVQEMHQPQAEIRTQKKIV